MKHLLKHIILAFSCPLPTCSALAPGLPGSLNLSIVRVGRDLFILIKPTIKYVSVKSVLEIYKKNDKIRDTFPMRKNPS